MNMRDLINIVTEGKKKDKETSKPTGKVYKIKSNPSRTDIVQLIYSITLDNLLFVERISSSGHRERLDREDQMDLIADIKSTIRNTDQFYPLEAADQWDYMLRQYSKKPEFKSDMLGDLYDTVYAGVEETARFIISYFKNKWNFAPYAPTYKIELYSIGLENFKIELGA